MKLIAHQLCDKVEEKEPLHLALINDLNKVKLVVVDEKGNRKESGCIATISDKGIFLHSGLANHGIARDGTKIYITNSR